MTLLGEKSETSMEPCHYGPEPPAHNCLHMREGMWLRSCFWPGSCWAVSTLRGRVGVSPLEFKDPELIHLPAPPSPEATLHRDKNFKYDSFLPAVLSGFQKARVPART